MLALVTFVAWALIDPSVPQGSDVDVSGEVAARFVKTGGASLCGKSVHWHVPAKTFAVPQKTRRGWCLFMLQGIGLAVAEDAEGLAEVRRRGHVACVRGRVVQVPERERAPGDPAFFISIETLSS